MTRFALAALAALAACAPAAVREAPPPPVEAPAALDLPRELAALGDWRDAPEAHMDERFAELVREAFALSELEPAADLLATEGFACAYTRAGVATCGKELADRACRHLWSVTLTPLDPMGGLLAAAEGTFERVCVGDE